MDNKMDQFDPKMWGDVTSTIFLEEFVNKKEYPKELHDFLFLGQAHNWEYPASTYRCRFNATKFENVNFHNKDFKDCLFDDCEFIDCEITFASIVSSTFRNCYFEKTPFKDEAIHDCFYQNCHFVKASFVGSMIRNSKIEKCQFDNCETSNKVFDACFLIGNQFNNTKLDFRVLQDNFGLSQSQIDNSLIRENRSYPYDKLFSFSQLSKGVEGVDLGAIDQWKIQYYQNNSLLFYGIKMDAAFNINYWTKGVQTPSNFVRFLENFAEFIIEEYQNNGCIYYLIVKLHALTYQIYKVLSQKTNFTNILQAVSGIHIRTGHIMNEIDEINFTISPNSENELRFRTIDGITKDEINSIINQIRETTNGFDFKIIKRNSPVDILFLIENYEAYLTIISFFLLSKTKLEIEKIIVNNDLNTNKEKLNEKSKTFSVSLGLVKEVNSVEIFSMSSNIWGNYTVSICLRVGTTLLKKIRKVLHEIISA